MNPERGLLTTAGLDQVRREAKHADVRLTTACHPTAGVDLTYLGHAVLLVTCHRCHQEVARLALAGGRPRGREDAHA